MLRKSTFLAVAATAALGLAMLNPTAADAKGGHGGGKGGHGMHGGGVKIHGGGHGIHIHHIRRHHYPRVHVRYHRPIWYASAPVYVARPVAGPCTCLSKEYTPEGAVLFKDRCTNEAAMNPPLPAPVQTGALEPQVQQYQQQYVQPQPK